MSNTVLLKDIADIITGPFGSQLHESDYVPEGIPSIMPQNIGNRILNYDGIARITEKDAKRLSRYLVKENDIVYARRGDVEKHAFISAQDEGALCGTGCLRVRIISDAVYPTYLSHFLNRPETRRWITLHAVGSNMPNINTDILGAVPIELPAYETQKAIADMLSDFDRKINLNTHLCAELEAMAKTLYDYWFVQFDFPDENGKPYRTSGGTMESCQELGREVPKGWKVKQLNEILILLKDGTHNPPRRIKSGIPLLTGTMFGNLFLDYSQATYISPVDYRTIHSQYAPQANDIILSKIGTLGNVNFLRSIDIPIAIHCNSALLRFPEYMSGMFSVMYCKSDDFIKRLKANKGQSVQEFCSLERIGSIKMLVPHLETIMDYNSKARAILTELERVSLENNELIHIRDWLLPMLMNGQAHIEVGGDESV